MTCRFPDDCRKKPDPRYSICRGCAISVAKKRPDFIEGLHKRQRDYLERRFAWLPIDRREEYRRLKALKYKASEARQIILQDMA